MTATDRQRREAAAKRERARYQRKKDRVLLVTIKVGPDLVDALETAYGVTIDDDAIVAAQVIAHALDKWQSAVDRLAPHRFGDADLTRQERTEEPVLLNRRKDSQ